MLVDKLEKEEAKSAALAAEVRALKDTMVAMESSSLPMCTWCHDCLHFPIICSCKSAFVPASHYVFV